MELITRRVINELEGGAASEETIKEYTDPESEKYEKMVQAICTRLHFTSLRYHRLDDMIAATGMPEDKLCTYCWSGNK